VIASADKTEFVAPRLGDEPEPEPERTAMIPRAEVRARQRSVSAPDLAPAPAPDKTAFIAPPPAPDATAFIAPPHAPDKTACIAPPPAFVAPAPSVAPPSVAPPIMATPAVSTPPAFTQASVISAPAPPAPTTRSAPSVDLAEHFSLAAAAFEQLLAATTPASLESWRGHLEVLASANSEQLEAHVRPELTKDPATHRFAAALLTLLHNKTWAAKRAFPQLLSELDETGRQAALRVLRSWDDPRAQVIAAAGLALEDTSMRATWLECFADRGWDPGAAAITAALADSDPRIISAGLRALPHCEAAASLEPKLASHVFAPDPSVRAQAIETSLLFANNSAWLVCHQLARNPSFPGAAELVGLLGTDAEIDKLRVALDSSPTPALLRGLGLSGRRVPLEACVVHFDDDDTQLRAAARECLEFAAGRGFASSPEANTWLDGQSPSRLLNGAARSSAQVLATLADAELPLRAAISRELRVRSRGRLHLDVDTLPEAWRRQLEQLGADDSFAAIDFERGFPWA
jgi:hypothetical protein